MIGGFSLVQLLILLAIIVFSLVVQTDWYKEWKSNKVKRKVVNKIVY